MRLLFAKAKWEASDQPLVPFLARAAEDGFDATEIHLPSLQETCTDIRKAHADAGLGLIAQISTSGADPASHARSLKEHYLRAVECGPINIVCHTGADWFSFEENLALFELALSLGSTHGTPICHESHRGRALYNLPDCFRYLTALPDLRLCADFSQWQVVHESSDLAAHDRALTAAISRSFHIHARVGFAEGPQVPDPRAPEWAGHVAISTAHWQRIVDTRRLEGAQPLTITPEFGPVPYMPTIPFENCPVADAWTLNCWMLAHLRAELKAD